MREMIQVVANENEYPDGGYFTIEFIVLNDDERIAWAKIYQVDAYDYGPYHTTMIADEWSQHSSETFLNFRIHRSKSSYQRYLDTGKDGYKNEGEWIKDNFKEDTVNIYGKIAYINELKVKEEYQGKGVGTVLLRNILVYLQKKAQTNFVLATVIPIEANSISKLQLDEEISKLNHFYQKFGFQINKDQQAFLNNQEYNSEFSELLPPPTQVEYWEGLAKEGDLTSFENLVSYYIEKEIKSKAYEWSVKGHEKGIPYCTYCLGLCYEEGYVVERDFSKAIEFYEKAADNGCDFAQNRYGRMLLKGEELHQNIEKGIDYLTLSANKGNRHSQVIIDSFQQEVKNK